MTGEEWFVDGHILDGHNPLLALDLNHPVDQQKGKAVRQDVENVDDVQRCLYRRRRCGRWVSSVGHFLSSASDRYWLGAKIILYRDSAAEYCENTRMKKILKKAATIAAPVRTRRSRQSTALLYGAEGSHH